MNRKRVLCFVQQKKIFFYVLVTMFSVILFAIINITITNRNIFTKQVIEQKKNDLKKKKIEMEKINNAISFMENYEIDKNLSKKYGFYSIFNKQEFIDAIVIKMNEINGGVEYLENKKTNQINLDYSNFSIKLKPIINDNLANIITQLKQKMIVNENQKINFSLETNLLTVDFQADYEYTVYQILEVMKRILPGNVVVKKISVKPAKESLKKMLYERRFVSQNKNDFTLELNNRLYCSIELEWEYLSSEKFKGGAM
jgi:hypothetical protein